jgi:hypothetical protein
VVELGVHDAPEDLVRAAVRAAVDEVVHANVIGRLARAAGNAPLAFVAVPTPIRDLAAVTLANAVEGCVREHDGAIELARLARHHAVLRPIAADEARHARLSYAIDAWARPKLTPANRRRTRDAIEEARST